MKKYEIVNSQIADKTNQAEKESNATFVYSEGAWGWVVVAAASYCFGILIGMINNYALIYEHLIEDFKGTEHHVLYSGKRLCYFLSSH